MYESGNNPPFKNDAIASFVYISWLANETAPTESLKLYSNEPSGEMSIDAAFAASSDMFLAVRSIYFPFRSEIFAHKLSPIKKVLYTLLC